MTAKQINTFFELIEQYPEHFYMDGNCCECQGCRNGKFETNICPFSDEKAMFSCKLQDRNILTPEQIDRYSNLYPEHFL